MLCSVLLQSEVSPPACFYKLLLLVVPASKENQLHSVQFLQLVTVSGQTSCDCYCRLLFLLRARVTVVLFSVCPPTFPSALPARPLVAERRRVRETVARAALTGAALETAIV